MKYLLVIDAGSSGSRLHVYNYDKARPGVLPQISLPNPTFKVEPGLSHHAGTPTGAGKSLQPLLEFARKAVPQGMHSSTQIILMATAGLRLLEPDARNGILASCRHTLSHSPFQFAASGAILDCSIIIQLYVGTVNPRYNKPPIQRTPGYNEPSQWAPP